MPLDFTGEEEPSTGSFGVRDHTVSMIFAEELVGGLMHPSGGYKGNTHVVVLAHTLKLTSPLLIRVSVPYPARKEATGNTLTVYADKIILGKQGRLMLETVDGLTTQLNVVYGEVEFAEGWAPGALPAGAKADGAAKPEQVSVIDLDRGKGNAGRFGTALRGGVTFKGYAPDGQDRMAAASGGRAAIAAHLKDCNGREVAEVIAVWSLARLDRLKKRLEPARLTGDKKAALALLARAKQIIDETKAPDDEYRLKFAQHARHFDVVRAELAPPVWRETVAVGEGVARRSTEIFVDGSDLSVRLAPTAIATVPRVAAGRELLGIAWVDPQRPDELKLYFEAALIADHVTGAGVARELAGRYGSLSGAFTDWKLTAAKIEDPQRLHREGLRDADISLTAGRLQCTLSLDAERANLALFRLGTSGLPVRLSYACARDAAVTGDFILPLTLLRSGGADLKVDAAGKVTNQGRQPVTISHYLLDDQPVPLRPLLVVAPNESVQLPVPAVAGASAAAGARKVTVPPEAATADRDPFSLDDFDTTKLSAPLETVHVTNLLAADEARGGALERVTFSLVRLIGDEPQGKEDRAGPYTLAARGTTGSEISVRFLRTSSAPARYRVVGTAYYDKGRSSHSIKSDLSDDTAIKIDERMLVAPATSGPTSGPGRTP